SEELRQALARGLQRLVAACIAGGALERAAGHARRWLQLDPLHEPAHQAIIRLHGWAGQRSAAMRQYRSLVRVLDRDLAVRPLPETTRLYDDVRAGRLGPPPVPVAALAVDETAADPAGRGAPAGVPADPGAPTDPGASAKPGASAVPGASMEPGAVVGPGAGEPGGTALAVPLTWPLVGRTAELAALRAAWRATGGSNAGRGGAGSSGAGSSGAGGSGAGGSGAGGSGRVVAIAGQAGSGKTRLIAELRTEAARAGAAVLAVRSHDGETGLPFVLAADLLRTALAVRPDLPDTLPAQTAAMAGRLVPALAASHPDSAAPPLDSPVAVTRLYAAIADTLQAAIGGGGGSRDTSETGGDGGSHGVGVAGIVVVEDVHWADSSSLGLLAYLVRRLADWPLLLVLSWQPEQAERLRVLRTALGEAESQSMGQTVEPGLLGPEAIGTLLGLDGMPKIDVSRLLAETRGLPMLVREYVEALRSAEVRGDTDEPGPWWPPASVRDLLRARLQAVSEPTRQ
ncbi:MAG TPA: AAA family ATPase, partial [Streptosporangiaceae bacterium]